MCGLVAIFGYQKSSPLVNEAELVRIREAMIHRGPDGAGTWVSEDQRVGLAHRRLAIIDTGPSGSQPMALNDDAGNARLQIVYNGEIYNFKQLRKNLISEGCVFTTNSDTEVLLHLYDRYGMAMINQLRGMFAFVIWDKVKQGMFLARDPYGIKPLYYNDDGSMFRVASTVKALIAGGAISTTPDAAGHIGFLTLGYVPEPHTMYQEIKCLPAGTSLWINKDGKPVKNKYFDFQAKMFDIESMSPQASKEQLREALIETAQCHLVADVPVGMFLSAGLDSASIVALVSEIADEKLATITLHFEEFANTNFDEVPLATELSDRYNTRHQNRTIRAIDFFNEKNKLIAAMDQPTIDGVNTYFVAKEASTIGLKVALSGVGGDELFSGYDSFHQVPSLVRGIGWIPFIKTFGSVFRMLTGATLKKLTLPKYASLFEYSSDYGSAYLLRRGLFLPWELSDFLDREFVQIGWQELNLKNDLNSTVAGITNPINRISLLESTWYMRNQLLRDADWAGMAHSLEIRTPLVDAVLFGQLANRGYLKSDMALSPKVPLPNNVINRKKTGFLTPVSKWMLDDDRDLKIDHGIRGWARYVYKEFQNE